MANTLPPEKMSVEEKLEAMKSIWDDLCSRAGGVTSSAWHGDILSERQTLVDQGEEKFEDWEEAKKKIRRV